MGRAESRSGDGAADPAAAATGGEADFASVFADRQRALLLIIALSMTVISLVPLWGRRFVPMQDYPQHLLQAQMLTAQNDPRLDYPENFEIRLKVGSYAAFYALTYGLDQLLPTEVAGKAAVSLYALLTGWLVVTLIIRSAGGFAPWGALLFFAVLFNQQYYLGNLNFLYSLPLLLLTLEDHRRFSEKRATVWSSLRQALWQLALLLSHPFTFLAYLGLAGTGSLLSRRDRGKLLRGLAPVAAGLSLLAIWFFLQQSHQGVSPDRIKWMPVERALLFLGLPFVGMRWEHGVSWFTSLIWIAIGCLMVYLPLRDRHKPTGILDRYALFLLLTTLAVLLMPFRVEDYTFVNMRMSSIAYFLLAMVCSRIRFRGASRCALPLLVLALLGHGVVKQWRISDEIARAEPVVTEIPRNARVMPLVFANDSPELEPRVFDTHLHVHNYYHILVGGGFSPYFWSMSMTPVHYKPGAERPAPGEYRPDRFEWQAHSADYQYFLVRGGPPAFDRYLTRWCERVADSEEWALYQRREARR
jgi:hypothetical protein